MALKFDLLPDGRCARKAAEYLAADIKARGNHLSTGFRRCQLSVAGSDPDAGNADAAYDLLRQDTFPVVAVLGETRCYHHLGALGWLDS